MADTFFARYHLPPRDVESPKRILDLGSNIGLTMAHFASRYPEARILGVEMDDGNVAMCERNVAPYSSRCQVIAGAVWHEDGEVSYSGDEEWGFHVSSKLEAPRRARTYTLQSLLTLLGCPVDYVKMDIEGAEQLILEKAGPWIRGIRCLKIEVHQPYTVEKCCVDLARLGFVPQIDHIHWACVIARNPSLLNPVN